MEFFFLYFIAPLLTATLVYFAVIYFLQEKITNLQTNLITQKREVGSLHVAILTLKESSQKIKEQIDGIDGALGKAFGENRTQLKDISENIGNVNSFIQQMFVPADRPAPNTTNQPDSTIEFSEHTMMDIPKDVKFEVEGGDSQVPPGF